MKHCSKCNKDLLYSEFYLRKHGPRTGEYYEKCKACMKIRGRNYYHNNHDRQLRLSLIRRRKLYKEKRDLLTKIKDIPCCDCNQRYPSCVMDFDHKDRSKKLRSVSHMLRYPLDMIMKEISKCDIVCANCHRIRTFNKLAEIKEILSHQ